MKRLKFLFPYSDQGALSAFYNSAEVLDTTYNDEGTLIEAFVDEKTRDILMEHIYNQDVHTTLQEKLFWNNKINVDDAYEQVSGELQNETLILNRN